MEEKKETKKEEKLGRYELVEIKQVVGYAIKDNQTGEVINDQQLLITLLNKIDKEVSHI